MKLMSLMLGLTVALTCGVTACSKKDNKGEGGAAQNKSGKPAGGKQGGAPATQDIAKLGLKADLPSGAAVKDGIGGDGVMIQGPGLVVSIEEASETRPKTVDDAKQEADMYTPKNIKTEDLADGWVLTFENTGSMGANYYVNVRREIGGKAYWCETTASQPAQQQNAVAVCKSLKQ